MRIDAGRKILLGARQALGDLLAREVNVDVVGEDGGHLAEAVARKRAGVFEPGYSRDRVLDRIGDLLFDLEGGKRRREGVDLHLIVGDVRHGVDWQSHKRPYAKRRGERRQQDDKPTASDREGDEILEHQPPPATRLFLAAC